MHGPPVAALSASIRAAREDESRIDGTNLRVVMPDGSEKLLVLLKGDSGWLLGDIVRANIEHNGGRGRHAGSRLRLFIRRSEADGNAGLSVAITKLVSGACTSLCSSSLTSLWRISLCLDWA